MGRLQGNSVTPHPSQPSLLSSGSEIPPGRIDLLEGHLCVRGGWSTARDLERFGWNDRELRAVASASGGRIISGQKGYCRIDEATVDEANHAASWLEHQAKAMQTRAYEIRQAMHKRSAA